MKELKDFYDLVMPELPGITTAMVDLQLVLVAREFCERSCAWRDDFDPINVVADRATYDLDASEPQADVIRIVRMELSDQVLWDDAWIPGTDGEPKYRVIEPPFTVSSDLTEFTLIDAEVPTASATGALLLRGAMRPALDAEGLPDLLLTVHGEAMRNGVLARLQRMPKKPWTDQALSGFCQQQYDSLTQLAASRAKRGNTRAPLRVRKAGL